MSNSELVTQLIELSCTPRRVIIAPASLLAAAADEIERLNALIQEWVDAEDADRSAAPWQYPEALERRHAAEHALQDEVRNG